MPGKGLLSSLADKAQAAIATSPLAGKVSLPGTTDPAAASGAGAAEGAHPGGAAAAGGAYGGRPSSDAGHGQPHYAPSAQEQSGTLSGRHYGLETIHHQLRSWQAQYSSGVSQENRQLQMLITAQKGVALDFDAIGRDAKAQSKELFMWGQAQGPDIKDVTDRLAYLNFVHGALSYTLATNIDKSRAVWKNVRDAEAALAPRRSARANIKAQLNNLKTQGGRGGGVDTKLQELDAQLKKAESDDAPLENELELLKRTAIRESETIKWKALQEYGHKILLLSTASEQLLKVLPSSPPAQYTGNQQTAAVRAALQNALDSDYVPKSEYLPLNVGKDIGETRSFGETHASELTSITTVTDDGHEHLNPPAHHDSSAPINPAALNNAPASIPHYKAPVGSPPPAASAAPVASAEHGATPAAAAHAAHYAPPSGAPPPGAAHYSPPGAAPPSTTAHSVPPSASATSGSVPHAPTVAETGVPLSAGAQGPGPASGSLADESRDRPSLGYGAGTNEQIPAYGGASAGPHESAEEEKRRLAAYQSAPPPSTTGLDPHQGSLVASTSIRRTGPARPAHESAEDEKRRLEREERERVLRGDDHNDQNDTYRQDPNDDDPSSGGAAPPAYHT